ncbi:preprotein translocase subunit SecE [Oleiagrimonas soli]|uniref:Protein translocase subunit SecE n=1 Tax=Oleiagrimonas soli TaxID=1543381 RepID=A0A099CTR3_9GAMM|nr:preprotein translocase subunit SecE [Oleiagrimonas soli]KGI77174.1 preprotein translocase subunit SecE [Oleiagrimonas soli]MBB6185659.1 preprotein translocase subunit SecE [Oleiagrimonas soli]
MNAKAEQTNKSSAGDKLMLVLAVLVLAAGLFGFYWYANAAQVVRAGVLVGGLVLSVGIVMLTGYGRRIRHFLAESQFEMRKVVWPSRDETVKTTIIILIVVVILALLLGAIDLLLKTVVLEWLLKLGK